jgi:hypothetical protein
MGATETAKNGCEPFAGGVLGGTQPEFTGKARPRTPRGGFVMQGDQAFGIGEQVAAIHGGTDAAGSLTQDRSPDALFQPCQLVAHGRLGEVKPLGGAGDAAEIDHRFKRSQGIDIQAHADLMTEID